MNKNKTIICPKGHKIVRAGICTVCPICDTPALDEILGKLSAPARRALGSKGIDSLSQLTNFSYEELKILHGMGPKALAIISKAMTDHHLSFKNNK